MSAHSNVSIYVCPGDKHPISRSVHLSRLAAFYPKCRDCVHRAETGQLGAETVKRLQSTERRVARPTLFTDEGVRGVYLNELSRKQAEQIAGALASRLWDDFPVLGRSASAGPRARRDGPMVVVGHDDRPASPDIVTGVAAVLRRMGCAVTDIGVTSTPCFWFAVDHLQAAAGLYVTGSGCAPSWTGMNLFCGSEARPLSRGTGLEEVERRFCEGYSRPTRRGGRQRRFQATVPYEASLWKHFHALKPLAICCGCPVRKVRERLGRILAKLSCQLRLVELPNRQRNPTDSQDADIHRMTHAVQKSECNLGILIDDDAQRCSFFDERGRLVGAGTILRLMVGRLLATHPTGHVILESAAGDLRGPLDTLGAQCTDGGETMGEMSRAMRMHSGMLGGGASGRFWFRESFPTCDALMTLARVLEILSRTGERFSQVVGSVNEPTD